MIFLQIEGGAMIFAAVCILIFLVIVMWVSLNLAINSRRKEIKVEMSKFAKWQMVSGRVVELPENPPVGVCYTDLQGRALKLYEPPKSPPVSRQISDEEKAYWGKPSPPNLSLIPDFHSTVILSGGANATNTAQIIYDAETEARAQAEAENAKRLAAGDYPIYVSQMNDPLAMTMEMMRIDEQRRIEEKQKELKKQKENFERGQRQPITEILSEIYDEQENKSDA